MCYVYFGTRNFGSKRPRREEQGETHDHDPWPENPVNPELKQFLPPYSISYEQRRKHLQSSEIYEELEFDTQTMRRAPRCIVRESMIVSTPYKESSRLVNTQPSTISRRSSRLCFSPRLRVYSMHDGYGR